MVVISCSLKYIYLPMLDLVSLNSIVAVWVKVKVKLSL
jgi:hypothetical protein